MRVNSISSYSMKSNNDLAKANNMTNSMLNETGADSVDFGAKIKAPKTNAPKTKGNVLFKILKAVGAAYALVGLALLSLLDSLLPSQDKEFHKNGKTGINDKDTSEYKGTSSSDLYNFYSK